MILTIIFAIHGGFIVASMHQCLTTFMNNPFMGFICLFALNVDLFKLLLLGACRLWTCWV
jgi:hypothetical protein